MRDRVASTDDGPVASVAVVVVNYNAGRWLARSVLAALQSAAVTEIIVVDNASTDSSIDDLGRLVDDERVSVDILGRNFGFGYAVNYAARQTSAPYLLLLNPDCLLRPTTLTTLVTLLKSRADCAACGPVVLDASGREQRGSRRREPTPLRAIARSFGRTADDAAGTGFDLHRTALPSTSVDVDAISGSCMLVRKKDFDAVGGMDPEYFLHCEDLDLCRRLRDQGGRICFVPHTSVIHLQGESGRNLRVEWFKHKSMLRYHKKHASVTTPTWATLLLRLGVYARLIVAAGPRALLTHRRRVNTNPVARLVEPVTTDRVLVVGALGGLASALINDLASRDIDVVAVRSGGNFGSGSSGWRRRPMVTNEFPIVDFEYLTKVTKEELGRFSCVYTFSSVARLTDLRVLLEGLSVKRIIASITADDSGHASGEDWARLEDDFENSDSLRRIQDAAHEAGQQLSILYPGLVYGDRDRVDLSSIENVARHVPWIPIFGAGSGLRQPLHIDELLGAYAAVARSEKSCGRTYRIGGGGRVSHRRMLQLVAQRQRPTVGIFSLPLGIGRAIEWAIHRLSGRRVNLLSVLCALDRDLVVDNREAAVDFNFRPGSLDADGRERSNLQV